MVTTVSMQPVLKDVNELRLDTVTGQSQHREDLLEVNENQDIDFEKIIFQALINEGKHVKVYFHNSLHLN